MLQCILLLNMYINMSSSMSKVIINIDNKGILLANIKFICKRFKAHLHHQSFPSKTWSKFLTENWLKEKSKLSRLHDQSF